MKSAVSAAGDFRIARPAAAAPLRRPEPVAQPRAAEAFVRRVRFSGGPRQG
jgi:hypothetical protein